MLAQKEEDRGAQNRARHLLKLKTLHSWRMLQAISKFTKSELPQAQGLGFACPSSAATIPEPSNLLAIAVAIPLLVTPGFQPNLRGIHRFDRAPLGHHPDFLGRTLQCRDDVDQFCVIRWTVHDKLQLVIGRAVHQPLHHVDWHPASLVKLAPLWMLFRVGGAGGKLRTDRQQVTLDFTIDGASRFDCQVQTSLTQQVAKLYRLFGQQRLATGQHNVRQSAVDDQLDDLVQLPGVALRIPRRVGRVAKPATEIAPACPNEEAVRARQFSLTLPTGKGFGHAQRPPSRRMRRVRESGFSKWRNQF